MRTTADRLHRGAEPPASPGGLRRPALAAACAIAAALAACGSDDGGSPGPDLASLQGACAQTGTTPTGTGFTLGPTGAPEISTGYASKDVVYSRRIMAVTANPQASKAACDVLKQGGTAVDAAVAAQMVLTLVEPQSSGIGGGAFLMHYDAASGAVRAYDGRETAPAAATENYLRWVGATDQTPPQPNSGSAASPFPQASGRSIGTPGVLRMLELAHQRHGRLSWGELFQPGIRLATDGFAISPRLYASVAATTGSASATTRALMSRDPDMAAYFLNADGSPKPIGTLLRNPALAQTYAAIAAGGANAFYGGPIAQDVVREIGETYGGTTTPGATTLADLANYQAKERAPVCTAYRATWRICGMPPPSSGGIAVAQILGILENFNLAQYAPTAIDKEGGRPTVDAVHLFSEANRLAYADRDKYVADTDFVPLPGGSPQAMLAKPYLAQRSRLIDLQRTMGRAQPGDLGPVPLGLSGPATENGTTHLTIVDVYGNVVSMTTTIESGFGSYHMVRGFLLNNQLTDFSAAPADASGTPIANRVQAGKRPRSSMAPTLVFRLAPDGGQGEFAMATGSPGGATIIQYVAKTLVGALDWGLNAQQAVSLVDFGASNSPSAADPSKSTTNVGGEHPNVSAANGGASDPLVQGLVARGHVVSVAQQSSGLGSIARTTLGGAPAWMGGADPRREGIVLGDLVAGP